MFAKISLNQENAKGKGVNEYSLKNYNHQFSFGMKEWQQDYHSINKREFSSKPVILSILY
jgi:hypothetical protein